MQLLRIEVLLMTALCRNKNFILFGSEVYMEKRYTESIGPIPNPVIQPMFGQYNMPHIIWYMYHITFFI